MPPLLGALAFTGGKDSMLALHVASGLVNLPGSTISGQTERVQVVRLVVFGPKGPNSFRAHPMPAMEAQAAALGLPLEICTVEAPFLEAYSRHITRLRQEHGITRLVTGAPQPLPPLLPPPTLLLPPPLRAACACIPYPMHPPAICAPQLHWGSNKKKAITASSAAAACAALDGTDRVPCTPLALPAVALAAPNSNTPPPTQPTGDIEDVCSGFMERAAAGTGVDLSRPLWQLERRLLLQALWGAGIEAQITCVTLGKFGGGPTAGQSSMGSTSSGQQASSATPAAACAACTCTAAPPAASVAASTAAPEPAADAAAGAAVGTGAPAAPLDELAAAGVDAMEDVLGAALTPELCSSSGALGRAHAAWGVDLCGEAGGGWRWGRGWVLGSPAMVGGGIRGAVSHASIAT